MFNFRYRKWTALDDTSLNQSLVGAVLLNQTAHPVDIHVGERLRALRKAIGMSQTVLGERLGLTFQQVQKYERGANRVSASKLYDAAVVLGVPISEFFAGLGGADGAKVQPQAVATMEVVKIMGKMSEDRQKQVLEMVRILDR